MIPRIKLAVYVFASRNLVHEAASAYLKGLRNVSDFARRNACASGKKVSKRRAVNETEGAGHPARRVQHELDAERAMGEGGSSPAGPFGPPGLERRNT
jgi:hypothetical protein